MSRRKASLPDTAVVLAAGESSRFAPFSSRSHHKSGFLLHDQPVIVHTLSALRLAGVSRAIVVVSAADTSLADLISPYSASLPQLTFVTQSAPRGMADAILSAAAHLSGHFLVVNPQQINIGDHLASLTSLSAFSPDRVYLFSQSTTEPARYGMLGISGDLVTRVVEKPADLAGLSDQRILGIYLLTADFLHFLQANYSTPAETEYQLEAALHAYAQTGRVSHVVSSAPALSLKYAWDLFSLSGHLFSSFSSSPRIDPTATIHPTAIITGPVIIGPRAKIFEYSLIQGPVYIGADALVGSFCKVRKDSVLSARSEIQHQVEVKHSFIGADTHIHSGFIGDSIIGDRGRIGAGFITANRRLDRSNIKIPVKNSLVDTHASFMGALIGDDVKIGIHCGTNPGTVIPSSSAVLPFTLATNPRLSPKK